MTTITASFSFQPTAFEKLQASLATPQAKSLWTAAALILTCLPYLLFV